MECKTSKLKETLKRINMPTYGWTRTFETEEAIVVLKKKRRGTGLLQISSRKKAPAKRRQKKRKKGELLWEVELPHEAPSFGIPAILSHGVLVLAAKNRQNSKIGQLVGIDVTTGTILYDRSEVFLEPFMRSTGSVLDNGRYVLFHDGALSLHAVDPATGKVAFVLGRR